jgi:8-oxo-dGTP pyrophosphatase MutT (NUDIX family)
MSQIRVVALALIEHNNRFLLAESKDNVKNETFYRPIGGGIEFGETGAETVTREVEEEIGYKIQNVDKLGEFENIFTFNGQPGHEIAIIYRADFVDEYPYTQDVLPKIDGYSQKVVWLSRSEIKNKKVYPSGVSKFIL